ncbi:ATP-binding protein [Alphaproteobacteria bacterium]|nr:ATP-binding protein [Alphaproteobacteria bacterium]
MRERDDFDENAFSSDLMFKVGRLLDDGLLLATSDCIVKTANSAAVRFLGEGMVGKSLFDIFSANKLGGKIEIPAIGEKESEFIFRPESAVPREFTVRVTTLGDGQIIAMLLDMTLQRNLEKVRRDFVANVSHELRSPLTSLAGFIETILVNDIRDHETTHRFLTIMDEEARRMSRLIDDLLSLSRVEVDEHIIPTDTVPLLKVVGAVIDSLGDRANRRDMTIKLIDRRETVPGNTVMFGHSDEINEVFHNLIENAVKYGFENSEIMVDIEMRTPELISIAVTNQGEPIAEKHLSRLTERFYRVDKARSRQIGGTGLGLAIVKHIINRHRGSLTIDSVDGATTFTVEFPVFERP